MSRILGELALSNIETLTIFAFFYAGIACSAIINPIIAKLVSRVSLLLAWISFGVLSSLLLLGIGISLPTGASAIALLLGSSIGIGLPSCLAFLADNTPVENRGKVGGITWAVASIGTLFLAVFSFSANVVIVILVLAVLRALGLLFFIFRHRGNALDAKTDPSYRSILNDGRTLLYLVPWIMFCLINWIESPIVENLFGQEFFGFVTVIELAVSGAFALIGGVLADLVGRKRIIITGFIMLGIEYAVLSFSQQMMISRYIYVFLDGISWGMFAVVFFITLWGDLAMDATKEKYYVVGGLPYLLASFLQVLIKQNVESIAVNTAFSLASFFLFLAVLPLMYASEMLPEKTMKDRELKTYVEKAKKKAEGK